MLLTWGSVLHHSGFTCTSREPKVLKWHLFQQLSGPTTPDEGTSELLKYLTFQPFACGFHSGPCTSDAIIRTYIRN